MNLIIVPKKMSEKARAVGGVKPGMIGITSCWELGHLGSPRGTTDLPSGNLT